jgi:MOSC domain-containing protein YiiM
MCDDPCMEDGRIEAIFISAQRGELPHPVQSVQAVAGKGLEGNRYFDTGRPHQELTLIEAEQLERALAEDGLEIDAAATGRNLLTRGVDLNDLVGRRFRVGEAECRGLELCEPCTTMEARTAPGAIKALVHRAGLNAEILVSGELRSGDEIAPL